jgi:hypothetical protein
MPNLSQHSQLQFALVHDAYLLHHTNHKQNFTLRILLLTTSSRATVSRLKRGEEAMTTAGPAQ